MKKILLMMALSVVLAGCAAPTVPQADVQPDQAAPAAGRAEVLIQNFKFIPATIDMGARDTMMITNLDSVAHTFTVAERGIDEVVPAGASLEVAAPDAGNFEVRCRFHPAMKAVLAVR